MSATIKSIIYGILVALIAHYWGHLSAGASIMIGWLASDIELIYWKVAELNAKI